MTVSPGAIRHWESHLSAPSLHAANSREIAVAGGDVMSLWIRAQRSPGQSGMSWLVGRHRVPAGATQSGGVAGPPTKHRLLIRRVAALTAVVMAVPVLTLGLTGGSAAASGAACKSPSRGPASSCRP
jgi:hypothetical protein